METLSDKHIRFIDTHAHLDGEEFVDDLDDVVARAKAVGVCRVFIPAIDLKSANSVLETCERYPDFACPMVGLHPEEVREGYKDVLEAIHCILSSPKASKIIGIGEVGLDYYWSREYEKEQLAVFEEQVRWSVETRLPLMIHCRKAQNEMVGLLRKYEKDLPGGVFHCFTGNEHEAEELLRFDNFALGIGGVLTFKKSHLPEVLPSCVPLDRIVLETDSPYMAPVPHRGKRNESAFMSEVLCKLASCYGVSSSEVAERTNGNVARIFKI